MKITEGALRQIIREEARKFKRAKRINESQANAENTLSSALEEYIDEMSLAGFGYEEICEQLQGFVSSYCETFLADLAPEDRDAGFEPGQTRY